MQLKLGTALLKISGIEYLFSKKKKVRSINSLSHNNHTEEYLKNMQLLKVDDVFNHNLATHVFKSILCYNYIQATYLRILTSTVIQSATETT